MADQPFVWGAAGRKMTPEDVERQRAVSMALMQQGSDFSPAGHWSEALGRAFNGWASGRLNTLAGEAGDAGRAGAKERIGANPVLSALLGGQGGSGVAPGVANASGMGGGGAWPSSLIQSESGGNWGALNNEGYGGRLQFGEARLADAARAGIIPAGMTGAAFSQLSPEQQMAVENWHFGDIDSQAEARGLGQYVGKTVGGVPITQNAIRGMAHLGGIGGAAQFLQSGGQYNPADSNGTSLRDYGLRHGGGGGSSYVQPNQNVVAALMEAQSDPWVKEVYGDQIAPLLQQQMGMQNAAYEQQLAQQDPLRQAQVAKAQMELEALRNPGPRSPVFEGGQWWDTNGGTPQALTQVAPDQTSAMQNYEYLVSMGEDPVIARDKAFGGGVTVNNQMGAARTGTIPPGYAIVDDATNPSGYRMEAIPGGPAAIAEGDIAKEKAKVVTQADQMLSSIDGILNDPALDTATGLLAATQRIPGTSAYRFGTRARQIEGQAFLQAFESLKGAGQITEIEGAKATAAIGRLDTAQSPADYRQALTELKGVISAARSRAAGANPTGSGDADLLSKYGLQ